MQKVGARRRAAGRYCGREGKRVGFGWNWTLTSPLALSPPSEGSGEGEELLGRISANRSPLAGLRIA